MTNVSALNSENDYREALTEIERYFISEPKLGSSEAERFDALAALIEDYEQKYWPIERADIRAALKQS